MITHLLRSFLSCSWITISLSVCCSLKLLAAGHTEIGYLMLKQKEHCVLVTAVDNM